MAKLCSQISQNVISSRCPTRRNKISLVCITEYACILLELFVGYICTIVSMDISLAWLFFWLMAQIPGLCANFLFFSGSGHKCLNIFAISWYFSISILMILHVCLKKTSSETQAVVIIFKREILFLLIRGRQVLLPWFSRFWGQKIKKTVTFLIFNLSFQLIP